MSLPKNNNYWKLRASLYRSRLDIIKDILTITKKEPTKTRIQYGANLSFNQLQVYLILLQDINFLRVDKNNGKSCYTTTKKGFGFLEKYQEIQNLISDSENVREINRFKL
jgi:predicted transcriptional regulator